LGANPVVGVLYLDSTVGEQQEAIAAVDWIEGELGDAVLS